MRAPFSDMDRYFDFLRRLDNEEGHSKSDESSFLGPCAIDQLCLDCRVEAKPLCKLVLMWKMGSIRRDTIDRAAWDLTMHIHGITNQDQLIAKLSRWAEQVEADEAQWTCMYDFLYDYLRRETTRQMTTHTAIEAWAVFYPHDARWAQWRRWVGTAYGAKYVSRDLWQQVRRYMSVSRASTPGVRDATAHSSRSRKDSGMEERDRAWPIVIEDFIEWEKRSHVRL